MIDGGGLRGFYFFLFKGLFKNENKREKALL
jgi:hypothetical protein